MKNQDTVYFEILTSEKMIQAKIDSNNKVGYVVMHLNHFLNTVQDMRKDYLGNVKKFEFIGAALLKSGMFQLMCCAEDAHMHLKFSNQQDKLYPLSDLYKEMIKYFKEKRWYNHSSGDFNHDFWANIPQSRTMFEGFQAFTPNEEKEISTKLLVKQVIPIKETRKK